jgi:hypothetical protein
MTTRAFTRKENTTEETQETLDALERRISEETDPTALKRLRAQSELLKDSLVVYLLYHCRCPELRRGIHLQDCLDKQQRYEDEGWVPSGPLMTEEDLKKMFDEEYAAR